MPALNHFTQTVIRTTERGEIMRWPAAHRVAEAAVSLISDLKAEPWRFDFYSVSAPDRAQLHGPSADRRQRLCAR